VEEEEVDRRRSPCMRWRSGERGSVSSQRSNGGLAARVESAPLSRQDAERKRATKDPSQVSHSFNSSQDPVCHTGSCMALIIQDQ
jgi:hypothetical protein